MKPLRSKILPFLHEWEKVEDFLLAWPSAFTGIGFFGKKKAT
jgi:hypothetical protein